MIHIENGKIRIDGKGKTILNEFACIVDELLGAGLPLVTLLEHVGIGAMLHYSDKDATDAEREADTEDWRSKFDDMFGDLMG